MSQKYKILTEYIKDISCETPDVETYFFAKENLSKYQLNIDINSKPLKNKIIEVNVILRFEDKVLENKKSYFEITYSAVVRIENDVDNKNEIKKIILCDVPTDIYPKLEQTFITLVKNSGFPDIKVEKKIDFEKLFNNSNKNN